MLPALAVSLKIFSKGFKGMPVISTNSRVRGGTFPDFSSIGLIFAINCSSSLLNVVRCVGLCRNVPVRATWPSSINDCNNTLNRKWEPEKFTDLDKAGSLVPCCDGLLA